MKKRYYVYILTNKSRTLYTGVTGNLQQRIYQHKTKSNPGFTSKYNIYKLIYFEEYYDIRLAITREKQIKGYRRSKKIALIESMNPGWKDIASELLA